jgi:flagellar basal body-associated protein FliL
MDWAALTTWILTASGGLTLLTIWLRNGGLRQRGRGAIRAIAILTHFTLAASGLVVWIAFVATGTTALAWVAFVILIGVASIGVAMLNLWLGQRGGAEPPQRAPAEQRFPVTIVSLHGTLAATTLVLVFLASAGVGT